MREEVATGCILHDDREVLISEEALLEAHDVRVDEHGMIEQLPFYIFCHLALHASQRETLEYPSPVLCAVSRRCRLALQVPWVDCTRIAQATECCCAMVWGWPCCLVFISVVHCAESHE